MAQKIRPGSLARFKEQAERMVDFHLSGDNPRFVAPSEDTATLFRAYSIRRRPEGVKAEDVADKDFAEEAKIRGVTAEQLADEVVARSNEAFKNKLRRIRLKVAIRTAKDHEAISRILQDNNVPWKQGILDVI